DTAILGAPNDGANDAGAAYFYAIKWKNGTPCTTGDKCETGFCVDNVCCSAACNNLCQACTSAKTMVADGTCAPVTAGTDPDNDCPAQQQSTCSTTGVCDGNGACTLYPQGTSCGASVCQGTVVAGQICNGTGTCTTSATGMDCSPFACSGGT